MDILRVRLCDMSRSGKVGVRDSVQTISKMRHSVSHAIFRASDIDPAHEITAVERKIDDSLIDRVRQHRMQTEEEANIDGKFRLFRRLRDRFKYGFHLGDTYSFVCSRVCTQVGTEAEFQQ